MTQESAESDAARREIWQRLAGIGERFRVSTAAWVTVMTGLVSAAVPATEAARGWSAQRMKDAETRSIIAQKELDQRATLATNYLDRLAKPDLKNEDRLMYLSALAQLDQHPLRIWAQGERTKQENEIGALANLATKIQQSVDAKREAQAEMDQLEGEIELAKLMLAQAKSFADLKKYRTGLLELNHRRNIMRASADLSGLMGEYRELVGSAGQSVFGVVLGDPEKFKKISARATEISRRATEIHTNIAALRLAAVAAWDADDGATAEEATNDAVQLCQVNAKPFRSDRDCTLITFAQVLSAFRVFVIRRDGGETEAAFRDADRVLRAAYSLREGLAPLRPGMPKGIESGHGHVRNAISVVGCWVYEKRSDPNPLWRNQADRMYVRQEALLTTIQFGYAKPEGTCGNLPDMNTIWP